MLNTAKEAAIYYEWLMGHGDPLSLLIKSCVSNANTCAAFYISSVDNNLLSLVNGYPEHGWEPAILVSDWGGPLSGMGRKIERNGRLWTVIPIHKNDVLLGLYITDDNIDVIETSSLVQRLFTALCCWSETTEPAEPWRFAIKSTERWMVCTKNGLLWWNEPLNTWLGGPPTGEVPWPSWVALESPVRRVEFWLSLTRNENWNGPVATVEAEKPMWWQITSLTDGRFLVRVNTYDELSSNTLAKSHWQTHDPVTCLPRQSAMLERWREDSTEDWGFAVWAIDNFHVLNQSHGMLVGDKVLEATANLIGRTLPPRWTLWRGRAETFYAMGPMPSDTDNWYVETLTIETSVPGIRDLRCSLGLTSGTDYRTCLLVAQEALEFAQASNGHQAVWNSSERRLRTPNAVAAAVAVMDPTVACNIIYLPIMTTTNPQRIQAFEALLRWHHPYWGILTPDMFWQEAERTDTIHKIGSWMIETLLKQIKDWQAMGHQDIEVHASVSVSQILNPAFTEFLINATTGFEWGGAKLMLEIPESDVASALDAWRKYRVQWKKLGIGIVLTDWGCGRSANPWLSQLDVNQIKISADLIQSLADARQRKMVAGLVRWLHDSGYIVIANGVETPEQKEWVSNIGCDAYQGYLNIRERKVIRWKN